LALSCEHFLFQPKLLSHLKTTSGKEWHNCICAGERAVFVA
jgi:hypothetical protein